MRETMYEQWRMATRLEKVYANGCCVSLDSTATLQWDTSRKYGQQRRKGYARDMSCPNLGESRLV